MPNPYDPSAYTDPNNNFSPNPGQSTNSGQQAIDPSAYSNQSNQNPTQSTAAPVTIPVQPPNPESGYPNAYENQKPLENQVNQNAGVNTYNNLDQSYTPQASSQYSNFQDPNQNFQESNFQEVNNTQDFNNNPYPNNNQVQAQDPNNYQNPYPESTANPQPTNTQYSQTSDPAGNYDHQMGRQFQEVSGQSNQEPNPYSNSPQPEPYNPNQSYNTQEPVVNPTNLNQIPPQTPPTPNNNVIGNNYPDLQIKPSVNPNLPPLQSNSTNVNASEYNPNLPINPQTSTSSNPVLDGLPASYSPTPQNQAAVPNKPQSKRWLIVLGIFLVVGLLIASVVLFMAAGNRNNEDDSSSDDTSTEQTDEENNSNQNTLQQASNLNTGGNQTPASASRVSSLTELTVSWLIRSFDTTSVDSNGNCLDIEVCGKNSDPDEDGVINIEELNFGTDPQRADSDSDKLSDGHELYVYYTNPKSVDSDLDGVLDQEELLTCLDPITDIETKMPATRLNQISDSIKTLPLVGITRTFWLDNEATNEDLLNGFISSSCQATQTDNSDETENSTEDSTDDTNTDSETTDSETETTDSEAGDTDVNTESTTTNTQITDNDQSV